MNVALDSEAFNCPVYLNELTEFLLLTYQDFLCREFLLLTVGVIHRNTEITPTEETYIGQLNITLDWVLLVFVRYLKMFKPNTF